MLIKSMTENQFYTYKKLQGSQTRLDITLPRITFYTYKKLQGSQTQGQKDVT